MDGDGSSDDSLWASGRGIFDRVRSMSDLENRADALRDAVNQASGIVRNLYFTFLLLGTYVAIIIGSNEAFNYGDAPVFPNRAVPRTDSLELAPTFKGFAPENTVLVADQILGRCMNASRCLTD